MLGSKTLMRVTWADYVPRKDDGDAEPIVRVCGRSADGGRITRRIRGCWPHTYVPDSADAHSLSVDVRDIQSGYELYDGSPVQRVQYRHPKETSDIKDEMPWTAEADVPFYRRATWDYGLNGYIRVPDSARCRIEDVETDIEPGDVESISPRVMVGDIEVQPQDDKSFDALSEQVEDPVVSISLWDSQEDDYHLLVLDAEGLVEPSDVLAHIEDRWQSHHLRDQMLERDIHLKSYDSEVDLLNAFIGVVQDRRPDVLSGWNWIDFDHDYLIERCRSLSGVEHRKLSDIGSVGGYRTVTAIDGLPGFDQLSAFDDKMSWSESRSLSLEYVASEEIGVGKIEGVDVTSEYDEDRSRLAAYNLIDTQLCVGITQKHNIEEFYLSLAEMSGLQIYDVEYEKRLVDGYIGSRRGEEEVMPNQHDKDLPQNAGGLVLAPSDGTTEWVATLDLKSLYPSSIMTCNISPETFGGGEETATIPGIPETADDVGGRIEPSDIVWSDDNSLPWSLRAKQYALDDTGIISRYLSNIFAARAQYKRLRDEAIEAGDDDRADSYDRKQRAVKVIMNSFYGVLTSPYYRLAEDHIGDAVTGVSRYVLWRTAEYVRDLGYEVVYGDTDSVMVKIHDEERDGSKSKQDILKNARGLRNQINSYMSEVADDLGIPDPNPALEGVDAGHVGSQHAWHFELEKLYSNFFQAGSKKRYAGNLCWKEGRWLDSDHPPDITGFESQRADVPEITETVQKEVISLVLDGAGFERVAGYVGSQVERVREGDDLSEIGVPISISKPLEEYPNRERVRAAEHANEHLGKEFGPGDTPWMYHVQRTPVGVEGTDVVALDWYDDIPDGYEIDVRKTVDKSFESALEPIIEEAGWSWQEVLSGRQVESSETEMEVDSDPMAGQSETSDESDTDDWTGAEAW